jgi:hypothetical protein
MRKNREILVVASKEMWLEINADNIKCMVMSRDQNAGQCQRIKTVNKSFEMVEQFKYL